MITPQNTVDSPRTTDTAYFPVMEGIRKSFGAHLVLNNLTLSLTKNGINCLLGPSGCGKSTLLRIAAGLISPDTGSLLQNPAHTAIVFQDPRLLPWLTVSENLSLAVPDKGKTNRAKSISMALEKVHLEGTQNHMPRELSGGMAQRVGIARALLRKPSFLLMDEPFAALDAITRTDLQKMLRQLIQQQGVTCLFVTHDVNEALAIADRIFLLKNGGITLDYSNSSIHADSIRNTIMQVLHY